MASLWNLNSAGQTQARERSFLSPDGSPASCGWLRQQDLRDCSLAVGFGQEGKGGERRGERKGERRGEEKGVERGGNRREKKESNSYHLVVDDYHMQHIVAEGVCHLRVRPVFDKKIVRLLATETSSKGKWKLAVVRETCAQRSIECSSALLSVRSLCKPKSHYHNPFINPNGQQRVLLFSLRQN